MEPYEVLKKQAKELFVKTDFLYCPAIEKTVSVTQKGFKHILFKRGQQSRKRSSQLLRFELLPLAFKLIQLTTTYHEYEHEVIEGSKNSIYWGLIAILDDKKIKVVLRKVGNGNIHFWSVMPNWITSQKRDEKLSLHSQFDPESISQDIETISIEIE